MKHRNPKRPPAANRDGGGDPSKSSSNSLSLPPATPAQRAAVKEVYVGTIGGNVLATQLDSFVKFADKDDGKLARHGAKTFLEGTCDSIQPRDGIEEMLAVQMAWTHARLARLSEIAHNQTAQPTFGCATTPATVRPRRSGGRVLALAEYRRPPRRDAFFAIGQANVANQQVVSNGSNTKNEKPVASNELGCATAAAVPPESGGAGGVAPSGAAEQAMDAQHRPENAGGQGTRES